MSKWEDREDGQLVSYSHLQLEETHKFSTNAK